MRKRRAASSAGRVVVDARAGRQPGGRVHRAVERRVVELGPVGVVGRRDAGAVEDRVQQRLRVVVVAGEAEVRADRDLRGGQAAEPRAERAVGGGA